MEKANSDIPRRRKTGSKSFGGDGERRRQRSRDISDEAIYQAGLGLFNSSNRRLFETLRKQGEALAIHVRVHRLPDDREWSQVKSSMEPEEVRMVEMIDAMSPNEVPTPEIVLQARRNSAARTELVQEFGLLSSSDVAELNQSKSKNRAALASRWKREGRIFSVRHRGQVYFPGFQFEPTGRPRAAIAAVLSSIGDARGWETALWFTAANGYLGGRRPVDRLEEDRESVLEAAEAEAADVFF